MNHELESEELRPFALQLSKAISRVRMALKEQCLTNREVYPQKVRMPVVTFPVLIYCVFGHVISHVISHVINHALRMLVP